MIKEFIKYYKPYRKLFMLDMLAAFTVALCDLVYPLITRSIMNDVVPNKDLRMLIVFAITLLVIFIIKAGLNYFMQYWGHVVGVRMQGDMRSYVFTHLQKLPNSYFNNNKTGVIMSRIINDLMEVSGHILDINKTLILYFNSPETASRRKRLPSSKNNEHESSL